jgi:hypothetical protein
MARARKLVRKPSKIRHASRWAAAAVVLLAVFSVARFGPQSENVETTTLPAPDLRSLDHDAYRPAVLFPSDGARIGVEGSMFRWSMVPGSLHYDVRVVSADGGMIWQERVEGTEWRLPTKLQLAEGEEYYFRVDAYLTEAKRVSSHHVLFRVEAAH